MEEIVTIISSQGIGLVIAATFLFALVRGIPKFFTWLGAQWEELKDVFKSYVNEQIQTMKELSLSNKELVETVSTITGKVAAIEDKVDSIEGKVGTLDYKMDALIDKIKKE